MVFILLMDSWQKSRKQLFEMLKILGIFLVEVALSGCFVSETVTENIPEVHVHHLGTLDPPGFLIRWDPVKIENENNPIIGFKIKLWETPCEIKTVFKNVDGQLMKVEKSQRQKFNHTTVPQEMPVVYIVTADEMTLTVPHVELDVWYHVRVIAFTKTAEGPLSNPIQFKINSDDNNTKKDKRCNKYTETPVADND